MKKLLLACGIAASAVQYASAADVRPQGDPASGEAQAAVCAACHAQDGNSMVPSFPKLAGLGERYLYEQLVAIRDGERVIAQMAGQVDNKTDQELADLAAYYDGFERSGGQTDPKLADLGEKVYRAGVAERGVAACTACHGPQGHGNDPAGFPALAGQHAEYLEGQLKAYATGYEQPGEGRYTDGESKIMRSNAFGLSDLELKAVASYIAGLQ
ncbi:c-type cytochrome [Pseudohaliea rubra]|nr:c-type cytochrome [Pseudohaliea rubra]